MYLTGIKLKNFKSLQTTDDIEYNNISNSLDESNDKTIKLKPITLFCGPNNSGKSSIIQSLLLFKQTLESNKSTKTMIYNGHYVDLENFQNIVYNKDIRNDLKFIFKFEETNLLPVMVQRPDKGGGNIYSELNSQSVGNEKRDSIITSIKLKYISNNDQIKSFSYSEYKTRKNELLKEKSNADVRAIKYVHRYSEERLKKKIPNLLSSAFSKRNKFLHTGWFYYKGIKGYDDMWDDTPSAKNLIELDINSLRPKINEIYLSDINQTKYKLVTDQLEAVNRALNALREIKYLGPLRVFARRREWTDNEVDDVGVRGEFATSILSRYYNLNREGILKNRYPDKEFEKILRFDYEQNEFSEFNSKDANLIDVTRYWLENMGVGGLSVKSIGDGIGHETLVNINNNNNNNENTAVKTTIKDIGFGISQVLPVLVSSLILKEDRTLILEQPEIHLHPEAQLKLADFFISMAKSRRRFIIETHSDHLVNRLVRRILESDLKNDNIRDLIAIYFIEKSPNSDTGAKISEIKIEETGITNWPKGFFDQAGNESMNILQLISKKQNKD